MGFGVCQVFFKTFFKLFLFFGLYAFGGNVTEGITFQDTTNEKAYSVKSRGGIVTTYITLSGTFAQDQTYEYDNFFNNNYPVKIGAGGTTSGLFAASYIGSSRNCEGHAEWDFINNKLIVRTQTTTTSSTSLKLTFILFIISFSSFILTS